MNSYKIMRLSEKLSIEVWKEIADLVQLLDIYSFDKEEFAKNLIFLREKLMESGKIINFGKSYPSCDTEIGLLNLLKEIYSAGVYNDYKKANFYEKIYQLDELGIPYIVFNPFNFPTKVEGIALLKNDNNETIGIKNCFTDGEIEIGYPDSPEDRWYDLVNVKDANYIINVLINENGDRKVINPDDSYVILRNFNGIFPSKETIFDIRYPGICMNSRYLDDGKKHYFTKQFFYEFDKDKANYRKKLVRMKDNYHYE